MRKTQIYIIFTKIFALSAAYSPLFLSPHHHQQQTSIQQSSDDDVIISTAKDTATSITRRNFFVTAGALVTSPLLINPSSAMAANNDDGLTKYEDEQCKFSLQIPSGWERSEQSLPDRRKIVLYVKPDSDKKTLVSLVYTPVRADFTTLGSFGSVDEVSSLLYTFTVFFFILCNCDFCSLLY